jgi:hypothetical protein
MNDQTELSLCKGMTVPRPATNNRPEVPSRPCRQRAAPGRDYCIAHDPDQEYVAERRRQNKLAADEQQAKYERNRQQGHLDHQLHLDRLFQLTMIPDTSSEHRCRTVGVLDMGSHRCDDYHGCSAELVQCDSYLEHESVGDHLSIKAYGGYHVDWRDER